jgi:soluble lytic murein transglycosylase
MKHFSLFTFIYLVLQSCTFTGPFQKKADSQMIMSLKNKLHSSTPLETLKSRPLQNLYPAVYLFAKDLLLKEEVSRACYYFEWLKQRQLPHPLEHFARYRFRVNCQSMVFQLQELDSFPAWLHEDLLRDATARSVNQLQHELKLALVDYEHTQAQKLVLIDSVLQVSKDHQLALMLREEVAPRFINSPSLDQLFDVAKDFEYIRDFNQARHYYEKIINAPSIELELKIQSYERIAQTAKVQRNREVYWKQLDKISQQLQALASQENHPLAWQAYIDNRITKARALWTAHQRSPGQEILLAIKDHLYASDNQKAQIHFILGSMEHEQSKFEEAIKYFKTGLSFPVSDNRILENLLWSYGWNIFQNKQYAQATQVFEEAFDRLPELHFQSKVLYWQAISYKRLGDNKSAKKYLEKLIDINPYSYYGFLAHHDLDRPLNPIIQHRSEFNLKEDLDWIYFFDETIAAQNYLKEFSENLDSKPNQILANLTQAELYDQAIFRYNRFQNTIAPNDILKLVPFGFPKPFLEHFTTFGNSFNFPVELALALTRQESAFNPYARSWADAFGLMQLIPERASEVARKLNLSLSSNEDLYDPKLNIQLGISHLSDLKRRFNHQFPFYIAAYNAGERPVRNWQEHRYDGDVIQFVENIPYRETQNYVKLIFRNAAFYRMLISTKQFKVRDLQLIE